MSPSESSRVKTMSPLQTIAPPVTVFVVLTLLAEGVVRLGGVPPWLLPAPTQVFAAMWQQRESLLQALGSTALAAGLGFFMATLLGVSLAIALASSRLVQRAFYPYAVFFQTVPIVAIAPLLVIWCGYDIRATIAAALVVSIFPVIANTLTGLRSTDPALVDLFRLYGAGPWATLWKLRLPAALPSLFTGLRVASGLAVIGAIVGEIFIAGGLGARMKEAQTWGRTDVVFAAILLASLLGLVMFAMVNLAAALTLRNWHASEQG